jgi:hypothetical protein
MLVNVEIIEDLLAEINVRSANQRIASIACQITTSLENGDAQLIDVSGLSPDLERIFVKAVRFTNSADSGSPPV